MAKKPAKKPPLSDAVKKPKFELGVDEDRLMEQRKRAMSEIKRRGGKADAPNNTSRLNKIDGALRDLRKPSLGINPPSQPPATKPAPAAPPAAQQPPAAQPPPAGQTPSKSDPLTVGQPGTNPPMSGGGDSLPGGQLPGGQLPGGQTPSNLAYQYQAGPAAGMFQDVFNRATQGSTQSFDKAANRLRERTDAATAGMADQARNRNLGRGFGNSGLNDADQFRVGQAGANAYAQGLVGLESEFEGYRLQGLNTAVGAASGAQTGELGRNQLMQDDLEGLRQFLGGRENRQTQWNIAQGGWNQDRWSQNSQQSWQGGQNTADRSLQQRIAELNNTGANQRASLNNLFNVPGLINVPPGGTVGGAGSGINTGLAPSLGGRTSTIAPTSVGRPMTGGSRSWSDISRTG